MCENQRINILGVPLLDWRLTEANLRFFQSADFQHYGSSAFDPFSRSLFVGYIGVDAFYCTFVHWLTEIVYREIKPIRVN